jgi:hypothetical protein
MTIAAMEIRDMLGKCFASGFVLRTAAIKQEDYRRNIYHELRNIALLQRTLFAISASLAAWQTIKLIPISIMTLNRLDHSLGDVLIAGSGTDNGSRWAPTYRK